MKPSPDDSCYCGSGQKYKTCCMSGNEVVDFQRASEKKALEKVFQKMERFLDSQDWEDELDTAEAIFYCKFEEDSEAGEDNADLLDRELEYDNFYNWFFMDYFVEGDFKPIDRFLAEFQDDLSSKEKQIATLLQSSHVSLYEVFKSVPYKELALRDIFTGREFFINDKLDFSEIDLGFVLSARLISIEDRSYPVELGFSFLPSEVPLIQELARQTRHDFSEKQKRELSREQFLKEAGAVFFNTYFLEHTKACQPSEDYPEKPGQLPYAQFKVLNFDAAREALRALPEIIFTLESLMVVEAEWIARREEGEKSINGYLTLIPAKLVFECQTTELLERGKKLLTGSLKNHILHQADHPGVPDDDFDEEMNQEEIEEYFRRWLDERQPVLNGYTPREAALIPDLRQRLVWLLKEIEYFERLNRKQGRNSYDVDRLKRELKLI